MKLTLRPYQEEMRKFLWETRRAFNTDWPGLGKTLESDAAVELPCIVVCRTFLTGQWANFLRAQHPDLVVSEASGTRKQRNEALDVVADYYVVNYEMLPTYAMPTNFKTVIFDESHHLRNRKAAKSRAAAKLVENPAIRVYMLTATPMWRELDDIWMQLHILYPKIFTSYNDFVDMFFITENTPYGTKILGTKKAMKKELDSILSPIKFGRSYDDVGRFLPSVIENIVNLQLNKAQKELYKKLKTDYKLKFGDGDDETQMIFNGAGLLHVLRQVTMGAGKVEAVLGIIEDVNAPHVVGTWYRDHAEMIHKELKNSVLITGDLAPDKRRKMAEEAERRKQHIVCTEASMCEGVNLSKYKHLIMVEEHWPPGANYQFISRVVRDRNDDGQDQEPVHITYIMVEKSVDTSIHSIAKRRSATMKDIVKEILL